MIFFSINFENYGSVHQVARTGSSRQTSTCYKDVEAPSLMGMKSNGQLSSIERPIKSLCLNFKRKCSSSIVHMRTLRFLITGCGQGVSLQCFVVAPLQNQQNREHAPN